MAIKWIPSAWRDDLKTHFPSRDRIYIDFRQYEYPPHYGHDLSYTLVASDDNQPGTYNLTDGNAKYLLDLTSTLTIETRVKPTFAYDVATDQPIWSWYIDATHRLRLFYQASSDKYVLAWQDGGTERILIQQSAYENNESLQVWTDIACIIDLTTGDTSGSTLYIDEIAEDSVWPGNIDVKSSNFPIFEVRAENGVEGDYTIAYMRLFLSKTVASADIGNRYKDIKEEEIYWYFNGEGVGRTRCNITDYVAGISHQKESENRAKIQTANKADIDLYSTDGEFADDQYAAFDPTDPVNGGFNGLISQKYLQNATLVIIESWYGDDFEPIFVGRVDDNFYTRTSGTGDTSKVHIGCEDKVADIAKRNETIALSYEDKKLSDGTEANSLIHLIVRQLSRTKIYNYAANSSFENEAIEESWVVSGDGATFSRVAGGLFGSYQGDLVYGTETCRVEQTILFAGTKKINVGEIYYFSVYLKSASACSYIMRLTEADSISDKDYTDTTWTLDGGDNWTRFDVAHKITGSTSDQLRITVFLDDNVTLSLDCVMHGQSDRAYNWFVLNNNNGSSGIESQADADSAIYDTIGFDVDAVNIVHPYVLIEENKSVWNYLKELANATAVQYLGIDASGCFKYRTPFKTGYSDPSSILTVNKTIKINTTLEAAVANKIIIRGISIVKSTKYEWLWDAVASGLWEREGDYLNETIVPAATWPETDRLPFWAKYTVLNQKKAELPAGQPAWIAWQSGVTYERSAWKPEIIGATNLDMIYSHPDLGEEIFDITTKADSIGIMLRNNTGANLALRRCTIKGKPIIRQPNAYVHKAFIDYESINRNGEIKFELENNFIVTRVQIEQLGDFWWKTLKDKKHKYSITVPWTQYWFEPGEWYTLQIQSEGKPEYINSVVKCTDVNVERSAGGLGSSTVIFREVLESWAKDSNAIADYICQGAIIGIVSKDKLIIASSTYLGPADYICDGTADEVEINAAITAIIDSGGGTIELTEGQFNIAATVYPDDNIYLRGRGNATIIEKNGDYRGIDISGSSGNNKKNIILKDFKLTRNASDLNYKSLMYIDYAEDIMIDNITLSDAYYYRALHMANIDRCTIANCTFKNNLDRGIYIVSNANDILILACRFDKNLYGIWTTADKSQIQNCLFTSNYSIGIKLSNANYNQVLNNRVTNGTPYAIHITGGYNNLIIGNFCNDNGQLIDRGDCESETPPMIFDETVPLLSNATFGRSDVKYLSGNYSYLCTKLY